MAHYAFINENNIVTEVITGIDEDVTEGLPEGFADWEAWYADFRGQTCKRTSYNTSANEHTDGGTAFRGNYAGIGYTYDTENDVFIEPKPFESWTLDSNFDWQPPIVKPTNPDDSLYDVLWDDDNQRWIAQGWNSSITNQIWNPSTSSWS